MTNSKLNSQDGKTYATRRRYGVPAKRGMQVMYRIDGTVGHIVGCHEFYVKVRMMYQGNNRVVKVHPFDLDYNIGDNEWVSGELLRKQYDVKMDMLNDQINRKLKQ